MEWRETTGSTNDDARAAAERGATDGHVVGADHQVAGRGASGSAWVSPAGLDLYFSIVARLPITADKVAPLTLAVGLGVAEALAETRSQLAGRVRVKWPNDVLIDDKKCCGILVESVSVGRALRAVVIGVGINVNRPAFEGSLVGEATSLRMASGESHVREAVLAASLTAIESRVDEFVRRGPQGISEALEAWLAWRGEAVHIGTVGGVLSHLASDGALVIQTGDTHTHVRSGSLRRTREDG